MSSISFKQKGNFKKFTSFAEHVKEHFYLGELDKYGREGVEALSAATPVDTGLTADSWYYEIVRENGRVSLNFCNSNIQNGVPIAVILQYGHATKNGSWVEGRNYIDPAIQPIFDKIAKSAWKGLTNK